MTASARFPLERLGEDAPDGASVLARARPEVDALLGREELPDAFERALEPLLVPLAIFVARQRQRAGRPLVVGVAGAQGSGKTTLAALLVCLLEHGLGLRAVALSLDDLYFPRAERVRLAREVHPLLATRGPGTHDLALGARVLDALLSARPGEKVHCPRFDKAVDERVPEAAWPSVEGPVEVVVLEGFCVCAQPQAEEALVTPLNAFERDEDADGSFRRYVNAQLAVAYRALFARVDLLVFLGVPDLASVRRFRGEQERKLAARAPGATSLLGPAALERFVQRFERISFEMLEHTPERADVVLRLGPDHAFVGVEVKR